jgi:hypothetical protein
MGWTRWDGSAPPRAAFFENFLHPALGWARVDARAATEYGIAETHGIPLLGCLRPAVGDPLQTFTPSILNAQVEQSGRLTTAASPSVEILTNSLLTQDELGPAVVQRSTQYCL